MVPKAEAGARIEWMDWATKVRERSERDGCDLHEAFRVTKFPERAWRRIVAAGLTATNPMVVIEVYEDMRSRVVKLAGSLVAVKITTTERRLAV